MISKEALDLFDEGKYSESCVIFKELLSTSLNENQQQSILFNIASCLASLDRYEEALDYLSQVNEKSFDVHYNKALCYYKLSNWNKASEVLNTLLSEVDTEHSSFIDDNDLIDDGTIRESNQVLVINLNSAIQYKMNYPDVSSLSKQLLVKVPFKKIEDYDAITLHNFAIYNYLSDQNSSIDIMKYLSRLDYDNSNANILREVIENLLSMLIDQNMISDVHSILSDQKFKEDNIISMNKFQFYDIISKPKSIETILKQLEKFMQILITKDESNSDDNNELLQALVTYMISHHWCHDQFKQVEEILLKVEPQLSKDLWWKTNLAHTIYMMDTRFEDAIQLYEELVSLIEVSNNENKNNILNVDPIVLGNLCVSYVLTSRNSEAESLIKKVEATRQEDDLSNNETLLLINNIGSANENYDVDQVKNFGEYVQYLYQNNRTTMQKTSHLCIINLIISTLYCLKFNYEFGLTRMFKTFEPIKEKLNSETWYQAKRCILSLLDCNCKQMINIYDNLFDRVVEFLIECEKYGLFIDTGFTSEDSDFIDKKEIDNFNSVTYEARYLRSIVLTMIHDR